MEPAADFMRPGPAKGKGVTRVEARSVRGGRRAKLVALIRMNEYRCLVTQVDDALEPVESGEITPPRSGAGSRWELYRLLADPIRPRLLALSADVEVGVGELAAALREGQPKISRHVAALREAGLLSARRQGTWTLLKTSGKARADVVVQDAIQAGRAVCRIDGSQERLDEVVLRRDAATIEFFARAGKAPRPGFPAEAAAYLLALAPLIERREVAVDAGTGDGALIEVLAPVFRRVVAVDRAQEQLALAAERLRRRDLSNVTLIPGGIDDPRVRAAVGPEGADVVFASRMLHHASSPSRTLRDLTALARAPESRPGGRGGAVVVLDYEAHDDEALRENQADLWLGFEPTELESLARAAGLEDLTLQKVPSAWQGDGPDRHLAWQLLVGFRRRSREAVTEAATEASREEKQP